MSNIFSKILLLSLFTALNSFLLSAQDHTKKEIKENHFNNLIKALTHKDYNSISHSKIILRYYYPNNKVQALKEMYWTGSIVNGKPNGKGEGLEIIDNKLYLLQGTYNEGIPLGDFIFAQFEMKNNFYNAKLFKGINVSFGKLSENRQSIKFDNGFFAFVDKDGRRVTEHLFKEVISPFNNKQATVINKDNQEIIINHLGEFISYSDKQKAILEKEEQENERFLKQNGYPKIVSTKSSKVFLDTEYTHTYSDGIVARYYKGGLSGKFNILERGKRRYYYREEAIKKSAWYITKKGYYPEDDEGFYPATDNSNDYSYQETPCDCNINLEKSTMPKTAKDWLGSYNKEGRIVMENGDQFVFFYNGNKDIFYRYSGFDKIKYNDLNDIIKYFKDECSKRCQ
ncbi:MAG: hypothetical protein N4A45_03285 [Flavobacteriales bacterium]|jgi:hypothetical protein|nr:hypothetical protein [Flavobacteriales bacterium]